MRYMGLGLAVLLGVCSMGCSQDARLSDQAVEELRSTYPMEALCGNPLYDVRALPLEEGVDITDAWVRVQCDAQMSDIVVNGETGQETDDSNISAVEEKIGAELSMQMTYHVYEMRVLDSVLGTMGEEDTFLLAVSDAYWDVLPDFAAGGEFLMGVKQSSQPQLEGYYETLGDLLFYITPDQYVLSVTATQPQNEMSGSIYAALKDEIASMKAKE